MLVPAKDIAHPAAQPVTHNRVAYAPGGDKSPPRGAGRFRQNADGEQKTARYSPLLTDPLEFGGEN